MLVSRGSLSRFYHPYLINLDLYLRAIKAGCLVMINGDVNDYYNISFVREPSNDEKWIIINNICRATRYKIEEVPFYG